MSKITNEAAMSQEISSLEQQMRYAHDLKEKIKEATEHLENGYLGLIDAKKTFETIKKENLEEIRRYKLSISMEIKEISASMQALNSMASPGSLSSLREFVSLSERLKSLTDSGFVESVTFKAKSSEGQS